MPRQWPARVALVYMGRRTTESVRIAARERSRRPGRTSLVAATALLVSLVAPLAVAVQPAGADKIGDARARAAQLARQIDANNERISLLDEQLNAANLRISQLQADIKSAQAAVATADRVSASLRGDLGTRAAALYRQGASEATGATTSQASSAAAVYSQALADRDQQTLSRYKRARQEQTARQKVLRGAEHAAEAQQHATLVARSQIAAANDQQRRLLAQTKGEIASLVKQAQADLAAAQAAAARRRMQQAADAANNNSGSSAPVGPPMHVVAPNPQAQTAVDTALAQIGKWYRFAAAGPTEFDCSGLTMYAWAAAGFSLPHSAAAQYAMLPHVPIGQVQAGDLVFYGSPIHHVGMVVSPGTMVEASHTGTQIRLSSYYRPDFAGAARVP